MAKENGSSFNMNSGAASSARTALFSFLFVFGLFITACLSILTGFFLRVAYPDEYGPVRGVSNDLEITYKELLFFASLVLSFFLLSCIARFTIKVWARKLIRMLVFNYLILAFIMVLVDIIHVQIFTSRFTFSSFQTLLASNPQEAGDFLKLYISPSRLICLLVFVTAGILVITQRRKLRRLLGSVHFFYLSMFISIAGVLQFAQLAHSQGNGLHNMRYWDVVIGDRNEYYAFDRKMSLQEEKNSRWGNYNAFTRRDTTSKTIVLVVSESLSRRHMSVYGYTRETTPRLRSRTDLIWFTDWITSSALTIEAVPSLFTYGHWKQRINLLTLADRLNFESTWISNQSGWGKNDAPVLALARTANNTIFAEDKSDDEVSNQSLHYDEGLLPYFENALRTPATKSKIIVLHLIGCHFDYGRRFPKERRHFTSGSSLPEPGVSSTAGGIINNYDNAVVYHDSVVNSIVDIFKRYTNGREAALLFLPDHGEEVFDYREFAGHGYPATRATAEIPAFITFSSLYELNNPGIVAMAKQRKNLPYSTGDNFFTVLNLMGVENPGFSKSLRARGLFGHEYDSARARIVMGVDYKNLK